MRVKVKMVEV